MIEDIITECKKGLHFPQHIYNWEDTGLSFAHCAICKSDYNIDSRAEKVYTPSPTSLYTSYEYVVLTKEV